MNFVPKPFASKGIYAVNNYYGFNRLAYFGNFGVPLRLFFRLIGYKK